MKTRVEVNLSHEIVNDCKILRREEMRNFIVRIQSSINPQKRKNFPPWFQAWFPLEP